MEASHRTVSPVDSSRSWPVLSFCTSFTYSRVSSIIQRLTSYQPHVRPSLLAGGASQQYYTSFCSQQRRVATERWLLLRGGFYKRLILFFIFFCSFFIMITPLLLIVIDYGDALAPPIHFGIKIHCRRRCRAERQQQSFGFIHSSALRFRTWNGLCR